MDELKIILSPEAEQNPKETIECLISAASAIFSKTENDFEEIKNTTWYKRLWKLITFSKDNEKKLANGVSSAAKLQEIIMKALLLLSDKSADISDFLCKHDEEIVRLSKNQASLAKNQSTISDEIERLKTGAKKTISLYNIEGDKRKIFITAFCSVVDLLNSELDHCVDYYNQIYYALDCTDAQSNIRLNSVSDTLNTEEQLLLYRVIMEYVFLATDSFVCKAEILDYLAVSPTDIEATKAYITAQVKRGRKESLLLKYKSEYEVNGYTLVDDDDIDWDFFESEDTSTVETTPQMETIHIAKLTQIRSGERLQFYKKNVYIEANIDCHGELEFFGCNIYYNAGESIGKITLSPKSQLNIWNSHVFGGSRDDSALVRGKQADISCLNSTFKNCANFIEIENSEIYMDKCGVYNSISNFIRTKVDYMSGIGQSKITNTLIVIDDLQTLEQAKEYRNGIAYVFDIQRCEYRNNLFYYPINATNTPWIILFTGESQHVENCTFIMLGDQRVSCANNSKVVSNCLFIGGYGVVSLNGSELEGNSKLSNSMFVGCKNSVSCYKDIIQGCTFVDCQRTSVEAQFRGGAVIDNCLFINTKVVPKESKDKWGNEISPCIKVYCEREFMEKGKNKPNTINNCTFYNLNNYDYIIAPSATGKPEEVIAQVENCRFINCDCVRAIQKDTYYYSDILSIKKTVRDVMKVENCEGVDLYGWRRNSEKTISNSEINVDLTEKPYGCEYLTSVFYFNHDLISDDKLRPWISDFEQRVIAEME